MATAASPLYQYYAPPTAGNAGYNSTSDPRQLAKNAAVFDTQTGGQLINQDQALSNEYAAQQGATQAYINPIAQGLAAGQGGYSPSEQQQILLSPDQQQAIKTGAGISAGVGNAAAVGGAERAAAATGGNPAAMATYRARAAQNQAANSGQASTQASIAAQQAGAQGAEQVGQARLNQQDTGIQFLGNEQAQQGQQALGEQGLAGQAYGTETSGLSSATDTGLKASQTPTTSDKIIGGIAGAASAFLDEGKPYQGDEQGMDAVLGEDGPELIVQGASDPVRSNTKFMDDGTLPGTDGATPLPTYANPSASPGGISAPTSVPVIPWWKQIAQQAQQNRQNNAPAQPGSQPQQPAWNPTTPYQQLGKAVGGIAGMLADGLPPGDGHRRGVVGDGLPMMAEGNFGRVGARFHWNDNPIKPPRPDHPVFNYFDRPHLADGDAGNLGGIPGQSSMSNQDPSINNPQLITKPTLVHLEKADAVVPLSFRPKAKIRPSAAMPAIHAMKQRRFFGAHA